MKILLADDNPEVRSALRLLLEQELFLTTIAEAADAQALLEHVRENCPAVLLLDWELSGLRGDDLLNMARTACPGLKIIALSSKFEARQEALTAQVDGFASKAEPPETILSILRSFISNPEVE